MGCEYISHGALQYINSRNVLNLMIHVKGGWIFELSMCEFSISRIFTDSAISLDAFQYYVFIRLLSIPSGYSSNWVLPLIRTGFFYSA